MTSSFLKNIYKGVLNIENFIEKGLVKNNNILNQEDIKNNVLDIYNDFFSKAIKFEYSNENERNLIELIKLNHILLNILGINNENFIDKFNEFIKNNNFLEIKYNKLDEFIRKRVNVLENEFLKNFFTQLLLNIYLNDYFNIIYKENNENDEIYKFVLIITIFFKIYFIY